MNLWRVSLLVFSFLLATCLSAEIKGKLLHHHMTKREIQEYFGVEDYDAVPEYHITHPYESDKHGQPRNRRNADKINDASYYDVDAFGKTMRLELKQNDKFMAPGLMAERRYSDGTIKAVAVSRKNHFLGKLSSEPDSLVAVTRDARGMTGMIRHKRHTMFIQPLPGHLAKHFSVKRSTQPHLIYKTHKLSKREANCETPVDNIDVSQIIKRDLSHQDDVGSETEQDVSANVIHKHLEVALVADELIANRLGSDIHTHLLLMGNIINGMFHDNSIGDSKITYVVTRLITITYAELDVSSSSSSFDKLRALQSWAGRNNPSDDADRLHFDVVSLVHQGSGGGLAVSGGLCASLSVGNVNNYIGLQTAGIIAHETAHNLRLGHDSDYGCANMVNIMASTVPSGPGAHKWSSCSRERIQTWLRSPGSSCLDDLPGADRVTLPAAYHKKLVGELVDADQQCKMQYSSAYSKCPQTIGNCGSLWCTIGDGTCNSKTAPVIDGTPCGAYGREWCIKGQCVDNGSPIIHGGWSAWSPDYSPCSRTCGGGVQHRKRTCTKPPPQNGGENCVGLSDGNWRTCNIKKCTNPKPSFRDMQCHDAENNNAAKSYQKAETPSCKLQCLLNGYITSRGTVKDSMRCFKEPEKHDVCIRGECQAVGCDHQLNSGKRLDRCGICDDDGQSCLQINSKYTKDHRDWGPGKADVIAELPVGTSNASFKMVAAENNVLGIKDENGKYVFNLPSWSRVIYRDGVKIVYDNKRYNYKTALYLTGRTTKVFSVVFVYIREKPQQGVTVNYYIPRLPGVEPNVTSFEWKASDWSVCSAACAGGIITRDVHCFRSDDQTPANNANCDASVKPTDQQPCNTNPCNPEWHTSPWQGCSKTCANGTQSRFITCRRKVNSDFYETLDDSMCDSNLKPQEATFKRCNEIHCPAEWFPLPWSECSKSCGSGVMKRDLRCVRANELGVTVPISSELCRHAEPKPHREEVCNDEVSCTAPQEFKIGCFKANSRPLTEEMADMRNEIDWENTVVAARKCAQLAHDKGYKYFALGENGICFSGQLVTDTNYFAKKGVSPQNCPSDVGDDTHIFIYSLASLPTPIPIGCYKNNLTAPALPRFYASFRRQIDWNNLNTTIQYCAHLAVANGYEYFGVQYYGECWSAVNPEDPYTYDKYGESRKCEAGVGKLRSYVVYQLRENVVNA